MSWALFGIEGATVGEAHAALLKGGAPDSIRAYVVAGISGLVAKYGDDVRVTVTGHGHLCDGPGSYEVTSATILVAVAEPVSAGVQNEDGEPTISFRSTPLPDAIDPNAGPTLAQWIEAGYLASNYPPAPYVSKNTPEEIAAAIADETALADAKVKAEGEAAATAEAAKAAAAAQEIENSESKDGGA
jgi:hypothetical protein